VTAGTCQVCASICTSVTTRACVTLAQTARGIGARSGTIAVGRDRGAARRRRPFARCAGARLRGAWTTGTSWRARPGCARTPTRWRRCSTPWPRRPGGAAVAASCSAGSSSGAAVGSGAPRSRRRSRSRARSVASGASWCPSLYRLRREPGSSGGCRSCPPPGQPATTAGRRPPVASRSSSPATSLNRTLVSCGCTAWVTPAGQGRRGGGIGVMRGEVDAMHSRGPVSSPRDCARWFSRSPVC
jgi:hypothetical protein